MRNLSIRSVVAALGLIGGMPTTATAQIASATLNTPSGCWDYHAGPGDSGITFGRNHISVDPVMTGLSPIREAQDVWARWTLYVYEKVLFAPIVYTPVFTSNWWVGTAMPDLTMPDVWTERIKDERTGGFRTGNRLATMNPTWAKEWPTRNVETWMYAEIQFVWVSNHPRYQANATKKIRVRGYCYWKP
jgi:hypothetical protein